jgi:predicted outer membrane repeat protein
MSHNVARDQRRGGRGTVEARRRRRLRPTLLALEDRRLLSTIVVNNPTDTPVAGETDLRQAIVEANTAGGNETITFDKTVFKTPQTINLIGGQLELSDTTGTETITGPKAGVTVNGGGNSRVFQVDPNVTASISGMTIAGGKAKLGGGILASRGTLTVDQSTISYNQATDGGGGIYASGGTLTVDQSTITGNFGFDGGGILASAGCTLTVNQSTISANSSGGWGGGIGAAGGILTVNQSTICDNHATDGGAGIFAGFFEPGVGVAMITVDQSTISGNTIGNGVLGGGGIYAGYATLIVAQSTISDNTAAFGNLGGGILASGCTLIVLQSTISGNTARLGGGIYASGTLTTLIVAQSTISNNSALTGGGLYISGGSQAEIDLSTINDPNGGGIYNDGSTVHLKRTVVDGVFYQDLYYA